MMQNMFLGSLNEIANPVRRPYVPVREQCDEELEDTDDGDSPRIEAKQKGSDYNTQRCGNDHIKRMRDQGAGDIDPWNTVMHLMQHSPGEGKMVLETVIPVSYESIDHVPNRYATYNTQWLSIKQAVFTQPRLGNH